MVCLLPSSSSLCSLHDRLINLYDMSIKRQGVEARNMTLFGKLADQEDGRIMSQNNHLVGDLEPERVGRVEKVK